MLRSENGMKKTAIRILCAAVLLLLTVGFCSADVPDNYITKVNIQNLNLPAVGDSLKYSGSVTLYSKGDTAIPMDFNPESIKWYKDDSTTPLENTDIRLRNTKYTVEFDLQFPESLVGLYSFNESVNVDFSESYHAPAESETYHRTSESLLKVRHTFLIPLDKVVVSDIVPISGAPLKTNLKITGNDVVPITDYIIRWYDSDYTTEYSGDTISTSGTKYVAKIYIEIPEGYVLGKNPRLSCDADNHDFLFEYLFPEQRFTIGFTPSKAQLSVNPFLLKINQGDELTISGTAEIVTDELITVDLITTAYVALPREAIGENSRVSGCSNINSDGTWSVTLDTAKLYADQYVCIVSGDSFETFKEYLMVTGENTYPGPTQKPSSDNLKLKRGWNFISVPFELSASHNTAADVFAGVNTNENAILSYNAKNQNWEQVKATSIIAPLNAYWVYSAEDKSIVVTFSTGTYTAPASKAVYKGWNAVGISTAHPMSVADIFNNINWRTYQVWNPSLQICDEIYIKGNKDSSSEDRIITNHWKGGWLFMDEDNTIIGYA